MSDLSAQQLANTATEAGDVIREALYCIENNYHDTRFVGETRVGFIKQALDQAHEQTDELVERLAVAEHDRDENFDALMDERTKAVAAEARVASLEAALTEIAAMSMQKLQWEGHLVAKAALAAVVSVGPTGPEGKTP